MALDFLNRLFGIEQSSYEGGSSNLPNDPKEVITILGKGEGYDYFGQLINHARGVINLNRKKSQRPTNGSVK